MIKLIMIKEVMVKASRFLLLLVAVYCLSATASAQTSASVVNVQTGESAYQIKRGSSAKIEVVLNIEDGYHINSNRPSDENLIATALKVGRMKGLSTTAVIYPKAKMHKFDFSDKPLAVYDGRTVLRFTARALRTLAPGSYTINAKLTVQACDNEKCLRPQTVDVNIPIEVM